MTLKTIKETQEQKQEKTQRLEKEYRDNIIDGFRNIDNERGAVKRNILEWAYMLEEELGKGLTKVEGSITSHIVRELKKEGLGPDKFNYVYEVLKDQFKRPYSKDGRHLKDENPPVEETEEGKIVRNKINQHLQELDEIVKTQDPYVTRDDVKTVYDKVDKLREYLDKKCDENNITRKNHSPGNHKQQEEEPITLRKGIPTPEEFQYLKDLAKEKYRKIRQIFHLIEQKLDTNSPQTVEAWMRLINGLDAFILMFEPSIDERHQRHWLDVAQIVKNYNDHGGTAASSKSKIDTYIINKKTGSPVRRAITKEHIDNNKDRWVDDFKFMVENIPIFFEEMCKFDETERTERATRAVELHDRLSESA